MKIIYNLNIKDRFKHFPNFVNVKMIEDEELNLIFQYALKYKREDLVKYTLHKEFSPGFKDIEFAARFNRRDLLNLFEQKDPEQMREGYFVLYGFLGAARGGHFDLIKYYISQIVMDEDDGEPELPNTWEDGMAKAARGGHFYIVKFFIKLGAQNWNLGAKKAAAAGHKNLIDFFVKKGATNETEILSELIRKGHIKNHIKISKSNCYEFLGAAVEAQNRNIINFCTKQYSDARESRIGLEAAAKIGLLELARYFIQYDLMKNREYSQQAVDNAARYDHIEVVKFLLQNGAAPQDVLEGATYGGHIKIVKYVVENYEIDFDGQIIDNLISIAKYHGSFAKLTDYYESLARERNIEVEW